MAIRIPPRDDVSPCPCGANPAKLEVRAELLGGHGAAGQLERMVSRISLEKGVSSVRWQLFELASD